MWVSFSCVQVNRDQKHHYWYVSSRAWGTLKFMANIKRREIFLRQFTYVRRYKRRKGIILIDGFKNKVNRAQREENGVFSRGCEQGEGSVKSYLVVRGDMDRWRGGWCSKGIH